LKYGIAAFIGGWVSYGVIVLNSLQNLVSVPEEYDWVKQVVAFIPVIIGHHALAWRYHTRNN